MAIRLDEGFLLDLGISSLPKQQKQKFLQQFYKVLELRVGLRMSHLMSARELDQFAWLAPSEEAGEVDDSPALNWLADNHPEFRIIVRREFDYMVGRIKSQVSEAAAPSVDPLIQPGDIRE